MVSREDIESCIQFIREEVTALRRIYPHLERAVVNGAVVRVPHPWRRAMRVAVALRSILRGADANKALGLTASEGTPVDMATHVRRARAVWPHMLAGCSLREAIDKLKEDEHARADDVSFESYRNSFRVLKKQLMSEALSNWTDDALTPLERAAFAEMMGKLPR